MRRFEQIGVDNGTSASVKPINPQKDLTSQAPSPSLDVRRNSKKNGELNEDGKMAVPRRIGLRSGAQN